MLGVSHSVWSDPEHDSNRVLAEHARPLISESEFNGLRSGLSNAEILDALPEWEEGDEAEVDHADWPTSRVYAITSVVTVSGGAVARSGRALAGYGLVVSRQGRVLRVRTESGALADYTVTDDTGHVLSDRGGVSQAELLPAVRAARMTGARPEHVILTSEALTILTLGFNTMDIIVTHAARVENSADAVAEVRQPDP